MCAHPQRYLLLAHIVSYFVVQCVVMINVDHGVIGRDAGTETQHDDLPTERAPFDGTMYAQNKVETYIRKLKAFCLLMYYFCFISESLLFYCSYITFINLEDFRVSSTLQLHLNV